MTEDDAVETQLDSSRRKKHRNLKGRKRGQSCGQAVDDIVATIS